MARRILIGIPISGGIAIGRVFFSESSNCAIRRELIADSAEAVQAELARLHQAALAVKSDLETSMERLPADLTEHAAVLRTHILLCDDPKLSAAAERRIKEHRLCAEWALEEAVQEIALTFDSLNDAYIRERIQDVRAVAGAISCALHGGEQALPGPTSRRILAAHDMAPSDALSLPLERIMGLVTAEGGKTSHTGILARGLRIPALVGVAGLDRANVDEQLVIVDGLRGRLLIDPDESELAHYTDLQLRFEHYQSALRRQAALPSKTLDGRLIPVSANIEFTGELPEVVEEKAAGIGLYRSEYAFLRQLRLPDEEELYHEYAQLASALPDHPIVIRTLDIGADKLHPTHTRFAEANPALGLRAIRYCLRHPHIFLTQLRAILRAASHGNIALLLPMVSGLQELLDARQLISEAAAGLRQKGIPHRADIPVGILVEVPAAVLMADILARHVDFFSIGTNDLVQYTLGIDRANRHVADLYQPLHPAVVRSIKIIVDAAHAAGITATVCGEMAADPYCLPILLGIGVDALSVPPQAVQVVRRIIRHSSLRDCASLLEDVLAAGTVAEINSLVRSNSYRHFPEELEFSVTLLGPLFDQNEAQPHN